MNTVFAFISPLIIVFIAYIHFGFQLVKEGELGVLAGFIVLVVSVLPLMLHLLNINLQERLRIKIIIEFLVGLVLISLLYIFI